MRRSGVYCITFPDGSAYVGSSHHIARREKSHQRSARLGKHHNTLLQSKVDKFGWGRFDVLEHCEPTREALVACEERWMERLKPSLNIARRATNGVGHSRNPQWMEGITDPREAMAKLRQGAGLTRVDVPERARITWDDVMRLSDPAESPKRNAQLRAAKKEKPAKKQDELAKPSKAVRALKSTSVLAILARKVAGTK